MNEASPTRNRSRFPASLASKAGTTSNESASTSVIKRFIQNHPLTGLGLRVCWFLLLISKLLWLQDICDVRRHNGEIVKYIGKCAKSAMWAVTGWRGIPVLSQSTSRRISCQLFLSEPQRLTGVLRHLVGGPEGFPDDIDDGVFDPLDLQQPRTDILADHARHAATGSG